MAYTPFNPNDFLAGKPVKTGLMTQIKDNIEDLKTDLDALQGDQILTLDAGTNPTLSVETIDTTYTTSNTGTVTLPTAASMSGRKLRFNLITASTLTLAGDGAENINDANTYVIRSDEASVEIESNGIQWYVIADANSFLVRNAGTAGAPAIALDSDPDTGFYWSGANELSFATDGSQRWKITSSGGLTATNGSRFYADDGSAAFPGISFAGDMDTGWRRNGSGDVYYVGDGTDYFRMRSNGLSFLNNARCYNSDGTALLPSITFESDPDNGFYRSGTNETSFSVAGTQRWTWLAGGSLRSQNGARFYIDDGSAALPGIGFASEVGTGMYKSDTNELSFSINTSKKWTINSSGNLTSAANKTYLPDGSASSPSYSFNSATGSGMYLSGSNVLFSRAGTGVAAFSFTDSLVSFIPLTNEGSNFGGDSFRWAKSFLHDLDVNGVCSGNLANGTYSPTTTIISGSSLTMNTVFYSRVGNIVTVSGRFQITTNTNALSEIRMSLPVSTTFANDGGVAGNVSWMNASSPTAAPNNDQTFIGGCFADPANSEAKIRCSLHNVLANKSLGILVFFQFQYEV